MKEMMYEERTSSRVRFFRWMFFGLAWALVGCITLQTLFAGMAIFNDPGHWSKHETFVHFFQFIPLIMLIFNAIGRLPKGTGWLTLTSFVLIYLQYMTAHLPAAGALHPVMALALIVLTLLVARRASATVFSRGKEG